MAGYLKREKNIGRATHRLLIDVRLIKSTGALKLVVNANDSVEKVVGNVLKCYARQGRFPLLGLDNTEFTLHSAIDCTHALDPSKLIGDAGTRSFLMLRNKTNLLEKDEGRIKNRMLITVNVMRSSIILKLVVSANDLVKHVVESALKCYARQGYLPLLGLDSQKFKLHSSIDSSQALEAYQCIGDCGTWNFLMFIKPMNSRQTKNNVECSKYCKWKNLFKNMGFKCGLWFD